MKERPILFTGAMVRALLDGTKTQTRRVCKPQPFDRSYSKHDHRMAYASGRASEGDEIDGFYAYSTSSGGKWQAKCPYGQPGDRLWVREATHRRPMLNLLTGEPLAPEYDGGAYTVDGEDVRTPGGFDLAWWYSRKACPSIHMPRWASRILLEIVSVRVERLQDISEADCWAEGIDAVDGTLDDMAIYELAHRMNRPFEDAAPTYAALWESINGAGSWDANPFCWVVEFKRVMP